MSVGFGEGLSVASWAATTVAALALWLALAWIQSFLRFHGVIGRGVAKVLPGGSKVALPPGRMGLPLVGETFQFVKAVRGRGLMEDFIVPRRQLYGAEVFKTHAFGRPMVVVSGPEAHKLGLGGEYKRVDSVLFKSLGDVLGPRSVLNATGDVHKYLRRMLVDPLAPATIKKITPRIEENVVRTLVDWEAKGELGAYEASRKFAYSVILDVLLSVRVGEDGRFQKFYSTMQRLVPGTHNVPIMIPGTPFYNGVMARKDMHALINEEISRRKKLEQWQWPEDVLSSMLRAVDDDGEKFAVDDLRDMAVTIMFGGYDSTSSTIACLVDHVYRHPDVLRRLQAENDAVRAELGPDGALSWDIIKGPKMRYTYMVIQETQRHMSLGYALLKTAKHDLEYEGFLIPKDWYVLVDVKSTHFNPAIYENPSQYNPSRFEKRPPPSTFIPFSQGPRACPGMELANVELALFLHHLVTKYSWVVTAEDQGMDFTSTIGRPRNRVPIRMQRRSE